MLNNQVKRPIYKYTQKQQSSSEKSIKNATIPNTRHTFSSIRARMAELEPFENSKSKELSV
jgi:hypothetical protein